MQLNEDFYIMCESMKITEEDYQIATEGVAADLVTELGVALGTYAGILLAAYGVVAISNAGVNKVIKKHDPKGEMARKVMIELKELIDNSDYEYYQFYLTPDMMENALKIESTGNKKKKGDKTSRAFFAVSSPSRQEKKSEDFKDSKVKFGLTFGKDFINGNDSTTALIASDKDKMKKYKEECEDAKKKVQAIIKGAGYRICDPEFNGTTRDSRFNVTFTF